MLVALFSIGGDHNGIHSNTHVAYLYCVHSNLYGVHNTLNACRIIHSNTHVAYLYGVHSNLYGVHS